jgi:hypothetical protein
MKIDNIGLRLKLIEILMKHNPEFASWEAANISQTEIFKDIMEIIEAHEEPTK